MQVVTLAGYQPTARVDGKPWTKARIEHTEELGEVTLGAGTIGGDPGEEEEEQWEEVETLDLDPVDADPALPASRTITTRSGKRFLRILFLDEDENQDNPSAPWSVGTHPFRPTVLQVSRILRARTYKLQSEGFVGGEFVGEFTSETRPSALEIEDLITEACVDVFRDVGQVPGVLLDDARRLAAIRTAADSERAYIPEQADGAANTIFQTLRMTYEEEIGVLRANLFALRLIAGGMQ